MIERIRSRAERLRNGQTVHCPDCGFGFPVTDEGAASEIERLTAELKDMSIGYMTASEIERLTATELHDLKRELKQAKESEQLTVACLNEAMDTIKNPDRDPTEKLASLLRSLIAAHE